MPSRVRIPLPAFDGENMEVRPRNLEVRKVIIALEKKSRSSKKQVWKKLASCINVPRRSRVSVNLWKLNKLAEKNKGKVLVVPGKVLSEGIFNQKAKIVALEISDRAKQKLLVSGEYLSYFELMDKVSANDLVIVK